LSHTDYDRGTRSEISESTISAILAGKRSLSRRHIAALSKVFRLRPALFFPEHFEMTPGRMAEILSRRSGLDLSQDLVVSLASAFALDPQERVGVPSKNWSLANGLAHRRV
jgi:transcriptional regulator with XRE-family HTH domain